MSHTERLREIAALHARFVDRFTREGGVWKLAERQLIVDRTEGEDIG